MMEWTRVEDALPPVGRDVFVSVRPSDGPPFAGWWPDLEALIRAHAEHAARREQFVGRYEIRAYVGVPAPITLGDGR